jgi:hypothetical protein
MKSASRWFTVLSGLLFFLARIVRARQSRTEKAHDLVLPRYEPDALQDE